MKPIDQDQRAKLEKEHKSLDREIAKLEKLGRFTDNQLHDLKKRKLQIRDQLERLDQDDQ